MILDARHATEKIIEIQWSMAWKMQEKDRVFQWYNCQWNRTQNTWVTVHPSSTTRGWLQICSKSTKNLRWCACFQKFPFTYCPDPSLRCQCEWSTALRGLRRPWATGIIFRARCTSLVELHGSWDASTSGNCLNGCTILIVFQKAFAQHQSHHQSTTEHLLSCYKRIVIIQADKG